MNSKKIEKSIIKYLNQEADSDDLDKLSEWIQIPENQLVFEEYIKVHYKVTLAMSNPNIIEIKKNLLKQIKKDQNRIYDYKFKLRKKIIKYSVAAAFLGILVIGYVFRNSMFVDFDDTTPTVGSTNAKIEPGNDEAILTLEDGSQIVLKEGTSYYTQNVKSNGGKIIYEPENKDLSKLVYNFLTIPRGGQFFIKLSDGTKVWLNSETQLKYPVKFIDGETRKVELVYGEAYFDVSPSTKHKGSKFKVLNQHQVIEVLGTEFNIKGYKDEPIVYTTLVKGTVAIKTLKAEQELVPNQQSIVDTKNNILSVSEVDVNTEISWKRGFFVFKGKPLKDIMKVMSRWYDIDVVFENKKLEEIKFKGVLGKNQNLDEILLTMKNLSVIKDYEIRNKTILLK